MKRPGAPTGPFHVKRPIPRRLQVPICRRQEVAVLDAATAAGGSNWTGAAAKRGNGTAGPRGRTRHLGTLVPRSRVPTAPGSACGALLVALGSARAAHRTRTRSRPPPAGTIGRPGERSPGVGHAVGQERGGGAGSRARRRPPHPAGPAGLSSDLTALAEGPSLCPRVGHRVPLTPVVPSGAGPAPVECAVSRETALPRDLGQAVAERAPGVRNEVVPGQLPRRPRSAAAANRRGGTTRAGRGLSGPVRPPRSGSRARTADHPCRPSCEPCGGRAPTVTR